MAIEFGGAYTERIDFGTGANVYGLTQKSISFWVYPDTVANTLPTNVRHVLSLFDVPTAGGESWAVTIGYGGNGYFGFVQGFSDGVGQGAWNTGADLSASAYQHCMITYDNSSVDNDPIIYINSVSKSLSELNTPEGTAKTGSTSYLRFGSGLQTTTFLSLDGKLQDVRIYNRILPQNEIEILANSRRLKVVQNGLVFWAPMWGTNDTTFDGLTLTASHRITDWAGGSVGTPVGSPIGRGNTIQSL